MRRGARAGRLAAGAGLLLAAGLAAAGLLVTARAGGNIETINTARTAILNVAWNNLAIPIPWRINAQGVINNCDNGNPQCVGGVSPLTLQNAIDGISSAFNTWQAVPTSRIAFTYAGTTTTTNIGTDNLHLITWADTNPTNCPTGVIAVTPNTALGAALTLTSSNRDINNDGIIDIDPAVYPDGTTLPAGTIIDADMAWCPGTSDFTTTPIDSPPSPALVLDMVAVATHELGHFHGLSHSSLTSPLATMFPFVDTTAEWGNDFAVISQDDIASTSRIYPEAGFTANYGTITGRVFFPGGTTPATGVSVTAFNRATGEMAVQVFTVSQFTATSDLPGSFRIDGLPPGTYLVGVDFFDGASTAGGDDAWWDNNRFNNTIFNSDVTGTAVRPTIIARPEFLSNPETSTDDLADPVPVTVAAGQTVNAGSIIINTDAPPTPTGATALNLPNGAYAHLVFPSGFTFPFFGRSYADTWVGDNGNLTFGNTVASDTSADTRNFLGPDQDPNFPASVPARIALPLTNLDPSGDNKGGNGGPLDAFARFVSDASGDRMEVIYQGTPVIATNKSCTAILRLFRSGRIELQYRFWSSWWGIVGISPGGTGTEPFADIDFSRQLPFSGSSGQAIFEHFGFGQPSIVGGDGHFHKGFDLNGALLIFTPNAAGGYDVTSPDLAVLPPGEVQNQIFTGGTGLAWDPLAGAVIYNVYRGNLGTFVDSDHDGAADAYGACLDPGLVSPSDSDATVPASGSGFYYLVTGKNSGGEGTLGVASSGAPRPNVSPCP